MDARGGDAADAVGDLFDRWRAHQDGSPDAVMALRQVVSTTSAEPCGRLAPEGPAAVAAAAPTPPLDGSPHVPAPRRDEAPGRHPLPRPVSGQGDHVAAGLEIVEALGLAPRPPAPETPDATETPEAPEAPEAEQDDEPARAPSPAVSLRAAVTSPGARTGVQAAVSEPEPRPVRRRATAFAPQASTDVFFPPRVAARRVVGLLLLVSVAGTATAGYQASYRQTTLSYGIGVILLVLSFVLWAIRASAQPVRVAIRSGQLEVLRGASRDIFDLTSRYTQLEVVGRPGKRGWKILLGRFGKAPLVLDASIVDPHTFTDALRRHRPEL